MTTNAIAISRGLASAGIEKQAADAIAEAVVTHSDESFATKADIAKLEGSIVRLETKLNIFIALNLAILIAFVVDKIVG